MFFNTKYKTHIRLVFMIILVSLFLPINLFASWQEDLTEYVANPIYAPGKAYYPSIIYDAGGFGNGSSGPFYKMWYTGSSGIDLAYSDDGINWNFEDSCVGLTKAHHIKVVFDKDGFGNGPGGPFYRIWYWDTSKLYSIKAIRSAGSNDGINWTNDQAITQDAVNQLITGGAGDWNRGSYGPVHTLYFPDAANSGVDPFDYSFVMYFDGTTGAFEQVGLAYSSDGYHWKSHNNEPVLSSGRDISEGWGNATPWDSSYVGTGTILIDGDGMFHFWFSGGTVKMHEGIGYAYSEDGINWTKSAENPILANSPGTWHDGRTYTPVVIYDENRFSDHGHNSQYKMWLTGQDSDGTRAVGYLGAPVASLTASNKTILPEIIEGENSNRFVSMVLNLSNDDIEDVILSKLVFNLSGSLLDAIQEVSLYLDTNNDMVLNDSDQLLNESVPSGMELSITLDKILLKSSETNLLFVVTISKGSSGSLRTALASQDDITGEGKDSLQLVKLGNYPITNDVIVLEYGEGQEVVNDEPTGQTAGDSPDSEGNVEDTNGDDQNTIDSFNNAKNLSIDGGGILGCALVPSIKKDNSNIIFYLILLSFITFLVLRSNLFSPRNRYNKDKYRRD